LITQLEPASQTHATPPSTTTSLLPWAHGGARATALACTELSSLARVIASNTLFLLWAATKILLLPSVWACNTGAFSTVSPHQHHPLQSRLFLGLRPPDDEAPSAAWSTSATSASCRLDPLRAVKHPLRPASASRLPNTPYIVMQLGTVHHDSPPCSARGSPLSPSRPDHHPPRATRFSPNPRRSPPLLRAKMRRLCNPCDQAPSAY
jgi:hypothetical protein